MVKSNHSNLVHRPVRGGEQLEPTLAGYQVVRLLGRGAGSTLYEVRDPADGKSYALKRVVREGPLQDRFIDQILVEHKVSAEVHHPAIRRTYRVKRLRSLLKTREVYLVMEYIDGVPLSESRPESMRSLVKVFRTTAAALAAMERAGFIHADIKPSNILLTPQGATRIIDLGQSCPVGTVKERIQGTPDYIAPEQVKRRALTVQTDMFNLGATMYWCLTGRAIPTLIPKIDEHGNPIKTREKFYPVDRLNPKVPVPLAKLVMNCLRTSPTNRPETWLTLLEQLDLVYLMLKRNSESTPKKHDRSGQVPCVV